MHVYMLLFTLQFLDCFHRSPVLITSQIYCSCVYRFIGAGLAPGFIPLLWDTLQLIPKYINLSVIKTIAIDAVKRKRKSKWYTWCPQSPASVFIIPGSAHEDIV